MTPIASNRQEVVTFILPVLNRCKVIIRAIESCLACQSERIEPRVLVIDGGSSDGTRELIELTFASDPRVVLLSQPADRAGFMNACFFAVEHLDSPLATFMYSDDLLSPYFVKLVEALAAAKDVSIAFGYGRQAAENEIIDFLPITAVEGVESERVLDAFYGRIERLDGKSMPVSPVCCVVRSPVLRAWVKHVQSFSANWPLRHHAMIQLAGGPDLMIYLASLLYGGGRALRTNEVVGQVTVTAVSITAIGNRETQLTIGYWLARTWGFWVARQTGRLELAGRFAGYLIAVWILILGKKLKRREWSWLPEFYGEFLEILKILLRQGSLARALGACIACLWSRLRMVLSN